ncbi:hypothetical protein SARC_00042 [Sphaeroforma arctica JP610]|uniref:Uncharacterized protein n=1 Tax=Sphaeroforma arctica JP610 TaxID=667725 RepID=A0A0L0GFZ9_9EUKA|nr:hypothetical protein SARC_00042 [Sphaeroforma arctica JP610]KNC87784.1 hypothetical protein SARC_00042 [Sphaeroforma arctica JP610]|eukprot:XP_014161686.1 hypothetical protein SARC_00042 [Sphaeroforma arctica JP610]
MPCVVGIDFGATNVCVAVARKDGTVEVVANDLGDFVTPACVSFNELESVVGGPAKQQLVRNSENTATGMKRLIGRKYADLSDADKKQANCKVVNKDGKPHYSVTFKEENATFTPEQLTTMLLEKVKETAEHFAGDSVFECVISVPATFTQEQKAALKQAAFDAKLSVLRFINEPTATCLQYGIGQKDGDRKRDIHVLVYDLGATHLTVNVLLVRDGLYQIVATETVADFGGISFDTRLMQYFAMEFMKKSKLDIRTSPRAIAKLRLECERITNVLTTANSTMAAIDSLMEGMDLHASMDRERFETLCEPIFQKAFEPIAAAIKKSEFSMDDIDYVIMTGGAAKVPKLQTLMHEYFQDVDAHIDYQYPTDQAVAMGAAQQASLLFGHSHSESNSEYDQTHVLAHSIGFEDSYGNFKTLLGANTALPTRKHLTFSMPKDQNDFLLRLFEGAQNEKKCTGCTLVAEIAARDVADKALQLTLYVREDSSVHVTLMNTENGERVFDERF